MEWREKFRSRSAHAFPIYACEKCWHGESFLSMHNKVILACPKCGGTMREVGIPITDAPSPCELLCLVCAHYRPWGIWDSVSGVAVCVECRDKARATPSSSPAGTPACVRARSSMTPCVVTDGIDAADDGGICVGCGACASSVLYLQAEASRPPLSPPASDGLSTSNSRIRGDKP